MTSDIRTGSDCRKKEEPVIRLDVPLESQFDPEYLGNGCEVTALSMLLNFYGYDTNKNELAAKLGLCPCLRR